MAEILGIDILITNSESRTKIDWFPTADMRWHVEVKIIQTMLEKSTIQVLEQSADSFNMEF